MGHGIGRSGDVAAVQPKAAGSSLMLQLTHRMLLNYVHFAGCPEARACVVLPVATGMALVLAMLALRARRPTARYVVWPRIDQKTCLKAITTAGFVPIIVENTLEGDELRSNVGAIEAAIEQLGPASVLCVATTTSCFAPRAPDRVEDVARACRRHDVPHLVNNAYGMQARTTMAAIARAARVGRVDCVVQSTDKNMLVPVGGAIVVAFDAARVDDVARLYPGPRAPPGRQPCGRCAGS